MQKILPLLEPFAERFDESLVAFPTLDLRGGLGIVRQRQGDHELEAHEERERIGCDSEISFNTGGLPGELIEATSKGGLTSVSAIWRKESRNGTGGAGAQAQRGATVVSFALAGEG